MTDDSVPVDSEKAKQIWDRYQQEHDVTNRVGQTAGIDVASGRVWFGNSIADVVAQRDTEGLDSPLYFVRVGASAYLRKGARL